MLNDEWRVEYVKIAFHYGSGFDKSLELKTRFDGNGNSIVRFVVTNYKNVVEYEKYDSALGAYEAIQ